MNLQVDPTYTLIMSDRLKDLNIRRNSKKKKNALLMLAMNESRKKARILIEEPHRPGECNTCGQIQRDEKNKLQIV